MAGKFSGSGIILPEISGLEFFSPGFFWLREKNSKFFEPERKFFLKIFDFEKKIARKLLAVKFFQAKIFRLQIF